MKKVNKKKSLTLKTPQINENSLFAHISKIIEKRKNRAGMYANREVTLMYWEIGRYIGSVLLGGERAEYGKKILVTLSQNLIKKYGSGYELRNLRRMIQFAELFPDLKIVSPLATHLSWSHFIEILPLETEKARLFYAHEAVTRQLGKRELRNQISRKSYERREISNTQIRFKRCRHFRKPLTLRPPSPSFALWFVWFVVKNSSLPHSPLESPQIQYYN